MLRLFLGLPIVFKGSQYSSSSRHFSSVMIVCENDPNAESKVRINKQSFFFSGSVEPQG